ncbi:hypothetical protein GLYMA_04G205900v4 [Glycine max]|uniref:Uncharacterized protein n=1 Tax=Glycine max TaxID=3847 RepID=A0A0R0KHX1_SOYBN|nr:hypothetical protein GYH30_010587 [Glycine max]KRH63939.1 hypothetical protein GLYMA_04G205900v4 [Glycine max]
MLKLFRAYQCFLGFFLVISIFMSVFTGCS